MRGTELLAPLVGAVTRWRAGTRAANARAAARAPAVGAAVSTPAAAPVRLPAPRRAPAPEPLQARAERPDLHARYGRMAEVAPAETVRRSFGDVEQLLRSVVTGHVEGGACDPGALARRARETGVIADATLQTIDGLVRRLRAACARPLSVHATHADAFLDAAATAEARLRRAAGRPGAGRQQALRTSA